MVGAYARHSFYRSGNMWTLLTTLGGSLISGVSTYFTDKQKIKKAKVEGEVKIIIAEAEAKVKMAELGQIQTYNLDMIATKNMAKTWKDDIVFYIFLVPMVLSFIPNMQPYVVDGFSALDGTPEWYRYILIMMIVVIFGMRGLARDVLKIIINKFSLRRNKI